MIEITARAENGAKLIIALEKAVKLAIKQLDAGEGPRLGYKDKKPTQNEIIVKIVGKNPKVQKALKSLIIGTIKRAKGKPSKKQPPKRRIKLTEEKRKKIQRRMINRKGPRSKLYYP